MRYRYSQLDHDNASWFANDMSKASLSQIELRQGKLRGLHPFKMPMTYPITVIAGPNGSGKSTVLAMTACAFHNAKNGFRLPERHVSYYTFSDFFIQTSEEVPPEGVLIGYQIRHNSWKKSSRCPTGIGTLWQKREKKKGGKWDRYSGRVNRNVVFLGIQRVVPPSEKTTSKNYRSYFINGTPTGWEDNVKGVVGSILQTPYDSFWMKTHGKYRMPVVASRGKVYSGFNMGAGENALFEIFFTIYATPPGTLLVIDEIELGLHESAQRCLILELKRLCKERQIQVICTTHSPAILASIPPEGRFFIQTFANKTIITPGITSEFASGQLSSSKSNELDVFVEDRVAARLLESAIPLDIRRRLNTIPIGSPAAIARQMAARYKEHRQTQCLAIMDGDQASRTDVHVDTFLKALESVENSPEAKTWFVGRLSFLPGETWPEKWLVDCIRAAELSKLSNFLQVTEHELSRCLEGVCTAKKHTEIFHLANLLSLDPDYVLGVIARYTVKERTSDFDKLMSLIKEFLR